MRFEDAQRSLVTQAADMTLDTLARMIEDGAIDVSPGYQRRERWDLDRRSALIESFLLNVPIPPIYLSEEQYGSYSVIDGKQRLSTVRDFLGDTFTLRGLRKFPELEGMRYSDLPWPVQSALRARPYLRVVTLLRQSDPDLKYEVFLRLNTGGERLNAQEVRNVAFEGPLNDRLITLSENPFLRRQLKIHGTSASAYRQMLDVEFVLRFLTLRETWKDFSGDLASSMNDFMEKYRHADAHQIDIFAKSFRLSLSLCEALWGEHAFRRPTGDTWRDQTLAGVYDAEMVGAWLAMSHREPDEVEDMREPALNGTRELFADTKFEHAVRVATNTPSSVRYRIGRTVEMLRSL